MKISKSALYGAVLPIIFFLPVFAGYFLLHYEPPPESEGGSMVATGARAALVFLNQGWDAGLRTLYFHRMGSGSLQSLFFAPAWAVTGGPDSVVRLAVHVFVLLFFGFFVWRIFLFWLPGVRALWATAFILSFPFLANEAIGFEHMPFLAFGSAALYFLWRSEFFTRSWMVLGCFGAVAGAMAYRIPETLVYLLPLMGLYLMEGARCGRLRGRDVRDISLVSFFVFSVMTYWSLVYWYGIELAPHIAGLLAGIGLFWELGRRRGVPAALRNFVAAVLIFAVVAFAPFASDILGWAVGSILFKEASPVWKSPVSFGGRALRFVEFFGGVPALLIPVGAAIQAAQRGRWFWGRWFFVSAPLVASCLLGVDAAHYFIAPVLLFFGISAIEILNSRALFARLGMAAMAFVIFWNLRTDFRVLNEWLSRGSTPPEVFEQISKLLPRDLHELRIGTTGDLLHESVDPTALELRALRQGYNWHFMDVTQLNFMTEKGTREEWGTCLAEDLDYLVLLRAATAANKPANGLEDLFTHLSTMEPKADMGLERIVRVPLTDGSLLEVFKGRLSPSSKERTGNYLAACDRFWARYQPSTPAAFLWRIFRARFASKAKIPFSSSLNN